MGEGSSDFVGLCTTRLNEAGCRVEAEPPAGRARAGGRTQGIAKAWRLTSKGEQIMSSNRGAFPSATGEELVQ